MTQSQKEFEAWCESNRYHIGKLDAGCYSNRDTRMMFESWQASRASLVVELPKHPIDHSCDDFSERYERGQADGISSALDEIKLSLKKVGISYK